MGSIRITDLLTSSYLLGSKSVSAQKVHSRRASVPSLSLIQPLCMLLLLFSSATYANSLSFGQFNQGVYSGSAPFNSTGTCTDPGDDCADDDLRIRSADIMSYAWSVLVSGIPAESPDFDAVIPITPVDTDGDGVYDAIELDADDDGISDLVETGGVDIDGDGMIDGFEDLDLDGVDDRVQANPPQLIDIDGDGNPDYIQIIDAVAPPAAAQNGVIHTGLAGSGCSIGHGSQKSDSSLLILALLSLLTVLLNGLRRKNVLLAFRSQ